MSKQIGRSGDEYPEGGNRPRTVAECLKLGRKEEEAAKGPACGRCGEPWTVKGNGTCSCGSRIVTVGGK